uniref:Uncharacterized protein n=1 Tax=Fundulus heteroclitus TaxID=8078 RepID=A0A3Q2U5D8_FUNHE
TNSGVLLLRIRFLSWSQFKEKNKLDDDSIPYRNGPWIKWQGSLPYGAVSIYNDYENRIDYICKVGCHSGFFNSSKGPYCHYPYRQEELLSSSFQILVNEGNLEIFVWKEDSYGSVPKNSVRTCSSEEIYVGKNKYGLGKVYPKDRCFYLPWEGSEYWYQKSYEVLTYMKAGEEIISDFKYFTDEAEIFKGPLKTLQTASTANNALRNVTETVSLTRTFRVEGRWDFRFSVTVGVKASVRVGIPIIMEGNIEISSDTTIGLSEGNTRIEEVSYSVTLQVTVPPNHSCKVSMVGYQYTIEVPYSARLSRTYENGETRSANITGTYHGVQTADVNVKVERCEPLFAKVC